MWIWVKTREQLATADDLRDSTINVDVDKGVITLTGTVASTQQMKKAESLASAIEGQKGVQNKLKVSADANNTNGNKNTKTGTANSKKG
jgi:osmotically-inducible protein OsmY